MIIPIPILIDKKEYSITPLTKTEKVWIWLVIIFCIKIVVGGVLLFFTENLGFILMIWSIVGGFLMNVIMMILFLVNK